MKYCTGTIYVYIYTGKRDEIWPARYGEQTQTSSPHLHVYLVRQYAQVRHSLCLEGPAIRTAIVTRDKRKMRGGRKRICIRSSLGWREIGCAGVTI